MHQGSCEGSSASLMVAVTPNDGDNGKKKRKWDSVNKDKVALLAELREEMDSLLVYFKEFIDISLDVEGHSSLSDESMVACLLEGSSLSYSKLVSIIYERMKSKEGVTLVSIRTKVLSVGQRTLYGISSEDVDVLEDESESCLWCWQVRNMKDFPINLCRTINLRRTARNKIKERRLVLTDAISSLENGDSLNSKLACKLQKTLNLDGIRSVVEEMKQKNNEAMAIRDNKAQEKSLIKEAVRKMRNSEKEKRKKDRQLEKEKMRSEKELRRVHADAEKYAKQQRKQQDEAEKEQKRREKEEQELKKQLVIQRQASMMERFVRSKKNDCKSDIAKNELTMKNSGPDSFCKKEGTATMLIDNALSLPKSWSLKDLKMLQQSGWRKLSRYKKSSHWGVRQKPRVDIVKELKLQCSSESKFSGYNAIADENTSSIQRVKRKLLQFDKSYRPAYYGTYSKTSCVVGPRHPFRKDPDMDYDVDSDDEWEEEEPGECLSGSEMDDAETSEEESQNSEEGDESDEDGFIVPDGCLSNEELSLENDDAAAAGFEWEEFRKLLKQQKALHSVTEEALRKKRPLVICNLEHEKANLLVLEDPPATFDKLEQLCLRALCMQVCPGFSAIELPTNDIPPPEDQETPLPASKSSSKNSGASSGSQETFSDTELIEFVNTVNSCPFGLTKVVESLHQKFAHVSKAHLKNKVREIAEYVDNRWQVKMDVLNRLGLSATPEKGERSKGIESYFAKSSHDSGRNRQAKGTCSALTLKSTMCSSFCSFASQM